jgi:hypothetical protein
LASLLLSDKPPLALFTPIPYQNQWILMRPELRVLKAETVVYQKNGLYASDHFAVYAEVEMPNKIEKR